VRAHTVLNLNVPILDDGAEPVGVRFVPINTSPITDRYESSEDENGDAQYAASGGLAFRHTPADTDVDALFKKYITVTPLHFDLTHHEALREWQARVGARHGH
jgi:5'-nucleotidase